MVNPIRNIIVQELNNNEVVKLKELYKIIDEFEDHSRNRTQKHHLVRTILDSFRKSGNITRVAPETYSKTGEHLF